MRMYSNCMPQVDSHKICMQHEKGVGALYQHVTVTKKALQSQITTKYAETEPSLFYA